MIATRSLPSGKRLLRTYLPATLASLAWLLIQNTRSVTSMSLVKIRQEFPDDDIGLLFMVGTATLVLMSVPAGWLADRAAPKKLILASLLVAVVAHVLSLFTLSYPFLIAMSFCHAAAAALVIPAAVKLLSDWTADLRGTAIGLIESLSMTLPALVSIFVFLLQYKEIGSWRSTYGVFMVLTVILAVAVMGTAKYAHPAPSRSAGIATEIPTAAIVNLLIGGFALLAMTGSVVSIIGATANLADADKRGAMSAYSQLSAVLGPTATCIGSVAMTVFSGHRARSIPIAFGSVCLLAAPAVALFASNDLGIKIVAVAFAQTLGQLMTAMLLSTIACWSIARVRGLLVGGFVLISTLTPGAVAFLYRLFGSPSEGFTASMMWFAFSLGAWALMHFWFAKSSIDKKLSAVSTT